MTNYYKYDLLLLMLPSPLSRKVLYVIVGLLILGIIGAFVRRSEPIASVPTQTVRVAVLPITGNLPHVIAQEKQLFEKQGLKAEFIPFASSNQVTEAMLRGDIDIAMISFIPFALVDQKEPGKLKIYNTSASTNEHPFDQLIVPKDSTITSIQELTGKKIGVFPGTSATNLAKQYLKKQNVDVVSIEFVQLPPQNQLAALASGSIDALYAYEPGLTTALVTQEARTISPSIFADLVDENPIGTGVITTKFITEHPELAKKTTAIIDEAIRFQTEHEFETRAIAQKAYQFDPAVAARFSLTPILENKKMNKAKVTELAEALVAIGDLPSMPNLEHAYYQP